MSETESGLPELNREWLAARFVFVAGFVIAITFAVLWSMTHRPEIADIQQANVAGESAAAGAPSNEGLMACRTAVILAENFGVVPNTLKFAGGPNKTDATGRYVCLADDNAGIRYSVTFDLICTNTGDARCVSVYQVTKPGGAVLFQRQTNAAEVSSETPAPDAPAASSAEAAPAAPADGNTTGASGDASSGSDNSAPQQQP